MLLLGVILMFSLDTFLGETVHVMSDFVSYYEPLHISTIIAPQLLENFSFQQIEFYAFQRVFVLNLHRGYSSVLHPQAQFVVNTKKGKKKTLDVRNYLGDIIEGTVKNEPGSFVHGTLKGNFFDGVLRLLEDTFFVESSKEFFAYPKPFASVIYRQSDVNFTGLLHCEANEGCDTHPLSYILGPFANETTPLKEKKGRQKRIISHIDTLDISPDIYLDEEEKVPKLQGPSSVCQLSIIVEHNFYQGIGNRNFQITMEYILYFVEEVNVIFRGLNFSSTWGNEINFQIHTVFIHKTQTEPNYLLYNEYLTAEEFLQKLAEYDFDGYCLGIAFAFRQFPKRVLGLAYLADPDPRGTLGGICQERKFVHTLKKSMSYNVAFVTLNNHGRRLPKLVTTISLAHELGHCFGSQHDPTVPKSQCNPSSGAYIMAEQAVEGNKENNRRFSPCSKKHIYNILLSKAPSCFTIKLPVCGNAIPEAFEECDCGHPLQCEETDPCCTPQGGIGRDAECTYRRMQDSECSPKKDGCCSPTCKKISAEARQMCASLACHEEMFCDGLTPQCPYSTPKEERMSCRERTGLCKKGQCIQKVCELKLNLVPCECKEMEFKCHACCKGYNTSCLPAFRFGIQSKDGMPVLRPAGEPCHEKGSSCNQLGDCVESYMYDTGGEGKTDYISRNQYMDGLIIAMIVTLVLLCLGIFICIVICFTPVARLLQRRPSPSKECVSSSPFVCITDHPSQSKSSTYRKVREQRSLSA